MKTTLRIAAITATIASTIQAETIVKWGDSPADTNIVTANARGLNQFGTSYDAASIGSPEDGAGDYALGIAGQTRTFYGAMSTENTVPIVNNSGVGDRIQMVHNFKGDPGALTSMIVWQASEFLTDSRVLDSMTVSYASRGGEGTTISFLIETTSGWYQSDQTELNATNVYADFSGTSASITWSPFGEFDVTAGEGEANTTDIKSVGLYSSSTNTSSNFIGGLVANFEVTAVSVAAPSLGITAFEFDEAGNLQIDFTGTPNTVYGVEFSPNLSTPFAPVTDLTATTDSSGDGFVPISAEEISSSKGFYRIVSAP